MSDPVQIRDDIAAGPKFDRDTDVRYCAACDEESNVDRVTGLCRPCWRIWRWAPKREQGRPGSPPVNG